VVADTINAVIIGAGFIVIAIHFGMNAIPQGITCIDRAWVVVITIISEVHTISSGRVAESNSARVSTCAKDRIMEANSIETKVCGAQIIIITIYWNVVTDPIFTEVIGTRIAIIAIHGIVVAEARVIAPIVRTWITIITSYRYVNAQTCGRIAVAINTWIRRDTGHWFMNTTPGCTIVQCTGIKVITIY
jgi:hypothetical protein